MFLPLMAKFQRLFAIFCSEEGVGRMAGSEKTKKPGAGPGLANLYAVKPRHLSAAFPTAAAAFAAFAALAPVAVMAAAAPTAAKAAAVTALE
jgi:hypothetical protein